MTPSNLLLFHLIPNFVAFGALPLMVLFRGAVVKGYGLGSAQTNLSLYCCSLQDLQVVTKTWHDLE